MLTGIGALAATVAAAVLITSGILKLGHERPFQLSIAALGLPGPMHETGTFARLFPWAEISIGVLVLLAPRWWYVVPLTVAIALFAGFLVVIARAARPRVGPVPHCNCFGGLGEDRIGGRTVVRNSVFLVTAVLGLMGLTSPASATEARLGSFWYVLPLLVSLAVAGGLVDYRRRRDLRRAMELLDSITVTNRAGAEISIREFSVEPTYLVFFSSTCSTCIWLAQRFRWWPNAIADGYDMQIIFIGGDADEFAEIAEFEPLVDHAWYDESKKFAKAVGMKGTPGVVLVDPRKPLGHGWIAGPQEMEKYVVREGFYDTSS